MVQRVDMYLSRDGKHHASALEAHAHEIALDIVKAGGTDINGSNFNIVRATALWFLRNPDRAVVGGIARITDYDAGPLLSPR